MRTKIVLLSTTIGLLGGVAAQAQVYSVNAVGYVNVNIPANTFVQIANPLNTTNNTIDALFPNAPASTTVYKFNGTSYDITTFIGGQWRPSGITLNPGEGAFIYSNETFTNTFVGEVMQSHLESLDLTVAVGYTMVGSKVPQTQNVNELGLTAALQDRDAIYSFNGTSYDIYTLLGGTWRPSVPVIEVGHAVFLNTAGSRTWTRTFDITP